MARNANRSLTTEEAATVAKFSPVLFATVGDGESYRIGYTDSKGEHSVKVGALHTVQGEDSTLSVKVETTDGPRTLSVRNILTLDHA